MTHINRAILTTLAVTIFFCVNVLAQGPPNSLLTGLTPADCVPPQPGICPPTGWTLVRTQNFETTLGAGESFIQTTAIQSDFAHGTGTKAAMRQYAGGDYQGGWILDGTQVNSREVYWSWYEFLEPQARINIDLFVGRRNLDGVTDLIFDWQPRAGCLYNCVDGDMSIFAEGVTPPDPPNFSIYDGIQNPKQGFWVQYEMHVKANDPGVSNGLMRLYQDGVLLQEAVNLNLNGTVEMAQSSVEVGGVYTSLTFYNDAAHTICSAPTEFGAFDVNYGDWSLPNPCPLQSPPSGFVPIFKRFFDDIIVLKR